MMIIIINMIIIIIIIIIIVIAAGATRAVGHLAAASEADAAQVLGRPGRPQGERLGRRARDAPRGHAQRAQLGRGPAQHLI